MGFNMIFRKGSFFVSKVRAKVPNKIGYIFSKTEIQNDSPKIK